MIEPRLYNNSHVKMQGIAYYSDCYNFWDLAHCKSNFEGPAYENLVTQIKKGCHPLWSGRMLMAVIPLEKYDRAHANYLGALSKNVRRDASIAQKRGLYLKEYDFNDFIPDFVEINHSQLDRNHRKHEKINPWYLQPGDAYKGMHTSRIHPWQNEHHYGAWFGVFKYLKHYQQDGKTTNEKLVAYCRVAFDGELAIMTLFWAHTQFFREGIMFYIVSELVKELMSYPNIKYMVYYSANQYPGWKQRMLLEPTYIRAVL
jgi:hypothetical protein